MILGENQSPVLSPINLRFTSKFLLTLPNKATYYTISGKKASLDEILIYVINTNLSVKIQYCIAYCQPIIYGNDHNLQVQNTR